MLWLLLSFKTATPGGYFAPADASRGFAGREQGAAQGGRVQGAAPGERGPVLSCGPSILPASADIRPDASGRFAPVFPGWGHYHYKITTTNDSAQFYFDQGLSLYYSYHLTESVASFKEAALKDSNCAMTYWGQALAMGPYYNISYFYKMSARILPVLEKMNGLAATATVKEKDLIAALDQRYSTDTTDSRRSLLNKAYSQGMKMLIPKYPNDNDIKALFIDGVMTEHAWDMWDNQGKPKAWTPELVSYCEEILAADPNHPAALHYHIHLLEASLHPEATLPSADKLKDLMPGVPHMVHMSSHSYQRTGLYVKGVVVNDSANAAQQTYSVLAPQLHLVPDVFHYDAVEAVCAMNAGMYDKGVQAAGKSCAIIAARPDLPGNNLQYLFMMPDFVRVRLGKWQAILDQPSPDSRWVFARLLSDFARGMAYVHIGDMRSAQACLDSLRGRWSNPSLKIRVLPYNIPFQVAAVAEGILDGTIDVAQQRPKAAMAAFYRAIEYEDGLSYLEPNDWPLPARHYAGACLLRLNEASDAEKLYREDLQQNPGNGWSLLGVAQSLEARHQNGAAEYRKRAAEAFAHASQIPVASVY
jgi:tetratricopeptide (TPR) repeat protein